MTTQNSLSKKKICIIGAGPAGMTAAYLLSQNPGFEVTLYEASKSVGGMAKSIELWGQTVDIGPHRFFSSDSRINKLWLEVIGKDYRMVNRLTRIIYNNKFYNYPIKAINAFVNLGPVEAFRCLLSYMWQKISPTKDNGDFESWVVSRFGYRLYSIFFKTYSEKLWGVPCTELDSEFAAQRIKKLSLFEAIKSAIIPDKSGKHKTLVDQFAYPLHGTGDLYEKMKEKFIKNGGVLKLETPIEQIIFDNDKKAIGVKLTNGRSEFYDETISTMPLTLLVSKIQFTPEIVKSTISKLSFRNTIIVYLEINKSDIFPDNWIYVHSKELRCGRITNFKNWVPEINNNQPNTIICMEFWDNDDGELWKSNDDVLHSLAKKELVATGLVESGQILNAFTYRVPKCYPVYSKGYKSNLDEVVKFLKTLTNIQFIGRYGAFKYNNQDHSILMGLLAAENLSGKNNDLWDINSDYEYQEHSKITETGLVEK